MEITINLPDKIFANLSVIAGKSRRRIDEVIFEKIARDFALNAENLARQISLCADKEVLALAEAQVPSKQNARLSNLLKKTKRTKFDHQGAKRIMGAAGIEPSYYAEKGFRLARNIPARIAWEKLTGH